MPRMLLPYMLLLAAALPPGTQAASPQAPDRPAPPAAGAPGLPETEDDVPWNSPKHTHFFRYQEYLNVTGLKGFTEKNWETVKPPKRLEEVKKQEEVIQERFYKLLTAHQHSDDDKKFLEVVWGPETAKQTERLRKARVAVDPGQIKMALKEVGALSNSVGNIGKDIGWQALFDGAGAYKGDSVDLGGKDFLAVEHKRDFLASLESPETGRILSTQKSFHNFLEEKSVAPAAIPGLLAMYGVLSKAEGGDREQTKHLLPTVVRLLKDGKKITADAKGALGYAYPGDYDRPEAIKVMAAADKLDPIVVGKTLAHETQHIYDMYTGRYYTLDSEMRGFKVAAIYFDTVRKAAPEKYEEMFNSDNDGVRAIVRDAADYSAALKKSPHDFAQAVAFGHGYNEWYEGVFQGRLPLREAVDPKLGAPRQLAAEIKLRDDAKAGVKVLEAREQDLLAMLDGDSSRTVDRELEKVSRDLRAARDYFAYYNKAVTLSRIRIKRMRSEVEWLDKQSKGADPEPYDLHLPVDKTYMVP